MNCCSFYGRVSSEIDMRYSDNLTVAQFSIAVNRRGKDNGADFFRFKAFNKAAEIIEKHFHKGSRIAVTATASQPPKYTNKDGKTIYPNVEFIVNSIDFVDTKAETPQTATVQEKEQKPPVSTPEEFMDLPEDAEDYMPFK